MSMNKKFKQFSLAPLVIIIVVLIWGFINSLDTKEPTISGNLAGKVAIAGAAENTSGWAWSENIGWISFNCDNDHDSATPGVQICTSMGGTDYGVNVDSVSGDFSGFAWSENIGWIKFDPAGPYLTDPPLDDFSARLHPANNKTRGWARACAGAANPDCTGGTHPDSGDWDGWIKMRGTAPNYEVTYDSGAKEFNGFVWGSDVMGWVSFNSKNCDPDGDGITEGGASNPAFPMCPDGSPSVTYAVVADVNTAPSASALSVAEGDYCSVPLHVFSWTFSDPEDGASQTSYELQADNDGDFSSPEISVSGGSSTSQTTIVAVSPAANQLAYNASYNWRVKVFDSGGADSGWVNYVDAASVPPNTFSTETHLYPDSDFTFNPAAPSEGEEITFDSKSDPGPGRLTVCYDISNSPTTCPVAAANYKWDFDYIAPTFDTDAIGKTATTTYSGASVKCDGVTPGQCVAFKIVDADLFTCLGTNDFSLEKPLPKFKEVPPSS